MIMKLRHYIAAVGIFFGAPFHALAQTEQTEVHPSNAFMNLLMTLLPIVLFGGFFWWFMKRLIGKNQRRTEDYIARQTQHMEKVEQTLERIARAVENNKADNSGPASKA